MRLVSRNKLSNQSDLIDLVIGVIVFGSIWGLFEVALGGGLQIANFPYRAGLLTGIGMSIMGIALVIYKRPTVLIGIGLVAVCVKLLAVPILCTSVMCKANSCLAVFTEAVALSLVSFPLMSIMSKSVHARMATGAMAALAASVGFYFVGMQVAPCKYLLSFTPGGFIVTEGLIWAAFSAISLPLGYLAGEKLLSKASPVQIRRSVYYPVATLAVLFCWGVSALAIAAGL